MLSTGELHGSRIGWFRTGLAIEGGAPLAEAISVAVSPSFAWERLVVDGRDDFLISQSGRDTRLTDFYDSGLRLGARYVLAAAWSIEFVSGFSARHESGADYANAIQTGGSLAVSYRRGSWLRLRLGVGLGADLADRKLRVTPVFRLQLKPWPDWTFESSGLGAKVEWQATSSTALSFGGQRDGTQYRLDRRGRPPLGSGDATLQRRQIRLDFGLTHRLASVSVCAAAWASCSTNSSR